MVCVDARDVRHRRIEQQRAVGTWDVGHSEPLDRCLQLKNLSCAASRQFPPAKPAVRLSSCTMRQPVGFSTDAHTAALSQGDRVTQIEQLHIDL